MASFSISTNVTLAINPEAVWGVPDILGAKYLRITGFNNKPEHGYFESEEISAVHRETADTIKGSTRGTGNVSTEMIYDNADALHESMFGAHYNAGVLKVGKERLSVTLQEGYTDLANVNHVYAGAVVNSMNLSIALRAPIKCSYGFVSKVPYDAIASAVGPIAPPNAFPVMNPLAHIILLDEGGAPIPGCQSFDLQLQNDVVEVGELSQADAVDMLLGRFRASGTFSVFKQSAARFAQTLTDAPTTITVTIGEGTRTYSYALPNVKITAVDAGASGSNPINERFAFTGLWDATDLSSVTITKGTGL